MPVESMSSEASEEVYRHRTHDERFIRTVLAAIDDGQVCPRERAAILADIQPVVRSGRTVGRKVQRLADGLTVIRMVADRGPTPWVERNLREMVRRGKAVDPETEPEPPAAIAA